ncbi:MAG: VOC family protein [Hyphomicrobiales bacterium]
MPPTTGVSHVSLTVSDLDRSIPFYEKAFGLATLFRGRNDTEGFEVAYLAEPSSGLLIGLTRHDAVDPGQFNPRLTGLDHFSIGVPDRAAVDAWARHLDEAGIEHEPPVEQPPFGTGMTFKDPDGIALEVYHLIPPAAAK